MLGAICGDIIGAPYEFNPIKHKDFELWPEAPMFTDDTVCTVMVAKALMQNLPIARTLADGVIKYPNSYGMHFCQWAHDGGKAPYGSYGNGSAMRVSAAGWLADSIEEAADLAEKSAAVTHDHPEGVRGAQATAVAIRMAAEGWSREEIARTIMDVYGYDLTRRLADIRPLYKFEVSCQKSVPEAIIAFLESRSYEDAIRNAISLGGDADTQACIAGGIAEAFYGGIGNDLVGKTKAALPPEFRTIVAELRDKVAAKEHRMQKTDAGRLKRFVAEKEQAFLSPDEREKYDREMAKIDKVLNGDRAEAEEIVRKRSLVQQAMAFHQRVVGNKKSSTD